MIEKYIEMKGLDKGRIRDIDIAEELADIEDGWREENGGSPVLPKHERPGKPEFTFEELLNMELKRLIGNKIIEDVNNKIDSLYENLPKERSEAAARKLSESRAAAFIELMDQQRKIIRPVKLFPASRDVKYSEVDKSKEVTWSIDWGTVPVDRGWVLRPSTPESSDGQTDSDSFKVHEVNPGLALSQKGEVYSVVTSESLRKVGVSYPREEAPFASDDGLYLLRRFAESYGNIRLPSELRNTKLVEID